MSAAVLVAMLCGVSAPLLAQAGVVHGRVVQVDSTTPVAGAEVRLGGAGPAVWSDSAGRFTLRAVPAGPVEIAVRQLGYQATAVRFALAAGEVRSVLVVLERFVTILDPITTTATRDPRTLSSVAAAVSVADTQAIERGRTVGLDETLQMMPGVQARSRYGTDDVNIGIRGSAARARQGVRGVALLLDGIPLTEPDGVARADLIELAAARQVEVVRGPVSALYAGSASGVVNVITRTGHDSRIATVAVEGGAYGFAKTSGWVGSEFADARGSVFAAGSYTDADNFRDHSGGNIGRAMVRGDYRAAARTLLAIDAEGSRLDTELPGSLTQAQFDADPDAASPAALFWNFGRADTRYRVGTRVVQGLDTSGNSEASAYFYYGGRTLFFPIPTQIVDLNFHRTQLGARYRAAQVGGAPLALAIGLDYDRVGGSDQRWSNIGGDADTVLDRGTDAAPSLGVYLQGDWQVGTTVNLTLGLRYDDVSYQFTSSIPGKVAAQSTSFDQWSPKLTASWQSGINTLLYASIAQGFEVPAFGELSASPGAPLNTSLYPKTLWNYELGAHGRLGSRFRYDAAVFYADVDGEFVPVTIDGVSLPENASHSRNVGIELGATWLATPWLDVSASYTYSDFRLLDYTTTVMNSVGDTVPVVYDNKLMPTIPRSRLTAAVVTRPLATLSLGVQFEWQSQMYVETGNQEEGVTYYRRTSTSPVIAVPFRAVPARGLFQLNARFQAGQVGLFASVENLFDVTYTSNVIGNAFDGAYYEAGSGTWLTLGSSISIWPQGR